MKTRPRLPVQKPFLQTTALLALPALLIGCVAINSRLHTGYQSGSGLAYYLPKGLLKITVVEEAVAVAPRQSGQTRTISRKEVRTVTQLATNIAPVEVAEGQTQFKGTALYTNYSMQSEDVNGVPAPPEKESYLTNRYVWAAVEVVPDRKCRYLLSMKPSVMADDYMQFKISNGLIESVTLTNSDQTVGVLTNLLGAAIQIFKAVSSGGLAAFAGQALWTTNVFLVDPFDAAQRERNRTNLLARCGVDLRFDDFEPTYGTSKPQLILNAPGVCYRPMQAYTLTWIADGQQGVASLMFPNQAPVFSLDVGRAFGVSQSYLLTFQQGFPSSVTLNKPSEVAGVAGLPLTVARSLVSLPTEILQLKFDYSSKNKELLAAKSQEITNLMRLWDTERQLEAARSNRTSQSSSGGSSASPQGVGGTLPK